MPAAGVQADSPFRSVLHLPPVRGSRADAVTPVTDASKRPKDLTSPLEWVADDPVEAASAADPVCQPDVRTDFCRLKVRHAHKLEGLPVPTAEAW